ncbi:probable serine/threonine-protein kinase kinX isoform X3 [Cyprinodon tularosa]|uniref:probable serine/threonine-protein kinase kinX isoform X3 n=1 Tax=Cyprinodon tularosa TaxID=77115 RepID=UPI0018E261EF|nr:probable serine/threonine-protein kinase kinX isoform X3 [Cyprinodon tularosa]
MSWFQSLRDDFTLRPFEIQHSPDSAAMASGSSDLVTNQEPAEVQEDCSGKKKSKFQTFKKLFARKKRKEPQSAGVEDGLKGSQSSDDVSKASENNALTRSEKDKGSGSKISLGNKALSHDSVFVSDSSEANEGLGASQDSISGKVKSLQLQLKQAIRLGSPPSLMCVKKSDDAGTMSEDDGLPCSPPDFTPLHSVKGNGDRNSSNSLHRIDGDEQLSCAASSRAGSPLVVPGDFSQPASPFVCLDNSAAKHKLGLRNKACNKRKPARRLELKAEGDSAVEEELTVSMIEAEVLEEQEPQRAEDESGDQLKPTVESEEEEDDEDSEAKKDSSEFPRVDKEGEDEPEAEQDVSHAPDASCPPESPVSSLSEEEASDDQHVHSSSSSSSSLDSLSVTPEPPAGPREHLTDPPGFSDSADNQYESDSSSGEDMVQESREEDGSFLEEVLSSLKASHSPDVEIRGFDLEVEKTEEKQVETDERVEIKGEEAEVEDFAGCEAAAWCPATSDQTAEENEQQQQEEEESEEEEEVPLSSQQEEEVVVEEEVKSTEEETEEEEEIIVERFLQHSDEEEAEGGESEEENNVVLSETVSQEEMEEGQENPEEEKTETVEERWEDREEEEGGAKVDVVEEGEDEEELREVVHESEDEEAQRGSPLQGAAEEDDAATNTDDGVPARRDEEEEMLKEDSGPEEEEEEVMLRDQESEDEEEQEVEGGALDVNQEELEQEREETSPLIYVDPVEASSKPPPLPLSESRSSSQSDEAPISSPSKTSSLNINLVSPTAEKTASPLELRPPVADPAESAETEEQQEAEKDEEEQRSEQEASRPPPAAVQEVRSEKPTDQSKARFTVAPAWQRLQNAPSSPSAGPAPQDGELEAEGSKHPELKAEPSSPVKAEPLQSPGRGRSSGSFTSKLQSSTPTEPLTAARTAEGAAVAEANPNSPFGVRLRKTTALLRLGSEEANSEPQVESPTHMPSFKNESPQPISNKPALSQQISNKPALSQPISNKPALSQPISNKPALSQPISNKPALPKKPEVPGDAGVKLRRISEPAPPQGASGGSDPPSWISVAKQKQKVYKETPLNEITVKKEEQEKKPTSLSNIKSVGASSKVAVEKENRRTLSVATPVPPQTPKPQAPPTPAKPTPHTESPRMPPSSPAPASIPLKSPASTTPSVPSKPRSLTSPPFSPSAVPEKPASRPSALSRQGGSPSTTLPQDEPPWMALAKKKAKAWSEMPQIVQ